MKAKDKVILLVWFVAIVFVTQHLFIVFAPNLIFIIAKHRSGKPLNTVIIAPKTDAKLRRVVLPNPDFIYNDIKLEVSSQQASQASLYMIPKLDLFHTTNLNKLNPNLNSQQYGLTANVNLFQFGKSHHNYLSQKSLYEVDRLDHSVKKIQIENKYLLTLFKNTLLQRKLSLYKQIENLKRKSLQVAQQRFNRGNLPRQQVDKVEIDLINLGSQRSATERELLDSELEVAKFQMTDFKREWPFSAVNAKTKNKRNSIEFTEIKVLELKSDAFVQQLEASRRNYLPQLDLAGHAYENRQDDLRSQEWDVTLTISWPLWDNYSRSLSNLNAYRDFQYWQIEKARTVRNWDLKVQAREEQLSKLVFQLNQSSENLKRLNALYTDTENLFSQGRLTVNELFQDQQLLLETQINNENEMFAFHQFILAYCEFYTERIWDCF